LLIFFFFFFFSSRRRHTRWPRDWSSDGALPISTVFRSSAARLPARSSLLSSSKSGAQVPGKVGVTGCAFLPRCERGGAFCTNPLLKRLGTTTLLMRYTCMRSYATSREHRSDINGSRQG